MTNSETTTELPASLTEIVEDFQEVPDPQRLELLLEFADELPELPERYAGHTEQMEQVVECQSPLFLAVELGGGTEAEHDGGAVAEASTGGAQRDPLVHLFITAPEEAPTTRGFASVLHQGLDGLPASTVLSAPEDIASRLGLAKALTPLRLRGMSAMLGRIKRNVERQLTSGTPETAEAPGAGR